MKRFPVLVTIVVAFAASGAAHADKLIIFKNGKAMKALSVERDGAWLKCEFENKNFVSVKASSVEAIEEAAVGSSEGELRTNKVAPGSGYVPPPPQQNFNPDPQQQQQQHEMQQQVHGQPEATDDGAAAMAEEQEAIRRQGGVVGGVRGGRRGGINQNNSPIQGIQPLVQPQQPFQGRRALTQRDYQRRGSRFGQPPPDQQGNQDN